LGRGGAEKAHDRHWRRLRVRAKRPRRSAADERDQLPSSHGRPRRPWDHGPGWMTITQRALGAWTRKGRASMRGACRRPGRRDVTGRRRAPSAWLKPYYERDGAVTAFPAATSAGTAAAIRGEARYAGGKALPASLPHAK